MPEASTSHTPPLVDEDTAVDQFDVSVVIVNYNVREFLEQALRSVERASAGLNVEVFVVDNNSVDGSVEMVEECFPDVQLIANRDNVGFSTANNQAIREARGQYLLILNPDTIIREDTLTTAVDFFEAHPDVGALGCKILNPDGTFARESRRAFPTPAVAFYRITGLSRLFPRSPRFGRYNMSYLPVDEVAEVDALSGSCMFVRRAALYENGSVGERGNGREGERERGGEGEREKGGEGEREQGAGLFDEDFFMYGEDLDWCYRIQQAGWKIFYTPATEIIHYKGESTKKGELRYVRLFYGAMIRFAEKHFHGRYSGLFIAFLRVGVLARAALSVAANTLRRCTTPLLELVLVYGVVALLGWLRSMQTGVAFSELFYGLVAPAYAVSTVLGIAMAGGYPRRGRLRSRSVWIGAGLALLLIATLSFFVKDLGFSRVVLLTAFPVSALLLMGTRALRRRRRTGPRRALVIGNPAEAQRLYDMLAANPDPPFELVGYVTDKGKRRSKRQKNDGALRQLGSFRQVRDLVRLTHISDVVFAANSLSNHTVFRLINELRDLPVQFRILAEGRSHVIGKASIDDLATPTLLEADERLVNLRSPVAHRTFDLSVATLGLLLWPLVALLSLPFGEKSKLRRLAHRFGQLRLVWTGARAVVGYHPEGPVPPQETELPPGVFSIPEALATPNPTPAQTNQAFWFWSIILRALRNL